MTSAGTSDRVLLLAGTLHSVLTAIFMILEKVSRDAQAGRNRGPAARGGSDHQDEVCARSLSFMCSAKPQRNVVRNRFITEQTGHPAWGISCPEDGQRSRLSLSFAALML